MRPQATASVAGVVVVFDRQAEIVQHCRQAVIVQIQHALGHFTRAEEFVLHLRQTVGFDRFLQTTHVELGEVRH